MTEVPPPGGRAPALVVSEDPGVPADLEHARAPGLFGAAGAAGYRPVPVLTIAGRRVDAGLSADLSQVVLDGLTVQWGRSDVLAQPDPATGTVELFDATRTWATERDLVGQLVTLHWEGGGAVPNYGSGSSVFFRGRVSDVHVQRRTVLNPVTGETIHGSVVALSLTSILNDLANVTPTVDWPAETLGQRRQRVSIAAGNTLPYGVSTREYWWPPQVAPVAADAQVTLYEHVQALYDSSGADRLSYWPGEGMTIHVPRRDYWTFRGMAQLWWDVSGSDTRVGQGVYARAWQVQPSGAVYPGPGTYLDGRQLEYDPAEGLRRPAASRITRVRVTHPDSGNGYQDAVSTLAIPGVDEVAVGVRTASLASLVAWNPWADLAASDLASFATEEGAAWQLEPVRWRVRDGFETNFQANLLLFGGETPAHVFLQATWLPEYGVRPIFGVMGAEMAYRNEAWDLALNLAPIVTTLRQHAITWEEMDDGSAAYEVQWWDDDHPRGMHASLTYEDLGHVAAGLGPLTVGPDEGWDALVGPVPIL